MSEPTYVRSVSVSSYVEHAQYHRGCSADTVLGVGSTPREALEDALESLVMGGEHVLLCDEPTAEESFGADADRYLAEEELAEYDRRPKYQLRHSSVTGCHPLTSENGPVFDSAEEANSAMSALADNLRARGFDVQSTDSGFEIGEPENCGMIPDEVGHLWVHDDEEEVERENEERRESSELSVYCELSLEVVDPVREAPGEDEVAALDVVGPEALRRARKAYRPMTSSHPATLDALPLSARQSWVALESSALARRMRGILRCSETVRDGMEECAALLGTTVEGIHHGNGGVPDGFALTYLNSGDSYGSTVLASGEESEEVLSVGSWAGALESAEEEHEEETGELRCGYCGEYGEPIPTVSQAFVRPGYDELPAAPAGCDVVVTSRSGGSTWGTIDGPADSVRSWLEEAEAPAPSIPSRTEEDPAGLERGPWARSVVVGAPGWEDELEPAGRPALCPYCGEEVLH